MGQLAIALDDATEAALYRAAQAVGVPPHFWLEALIRRHACGGRDPALLIVDDDPVCRELLRCQVESLCESLCESLPESMSECFGDAPGWRIDTAANGAEALALLAERRYRLLLTDCRMPVMDGYQLAHAIRSHERRFGLLPLPIVAVTSESLVTDGAFCHELGFDHCLPKPPPERVLASILAHHLGPVLARPPSGPDAGCRPAAHARHPVAQSSGE